jgi:hypothetical protein
VAALHVYLGDLCFATIPRELSEGDRLACRSDRQDLHAAAERDIALLLVVFAGVLV